MIIHLDKVGRRFNREWIFRNITLDIQPGTKLAILGGNGSGKSTLLQVIAGSLYPTEGKVFFENNNQTISSDLQYRHISMATPYLELVEEFTLSELVNFHSKFKKLQSGVTADQLIEIAYLKAARNKEIRHYSSGMKQRTKLALALLSDVPVVLLDEPATNLDQQAIEWFQDMITRHASARTVIVCSNRQEAEHDFCTTQIVMEDFK